MQPIKQLVTQITQFRFLTISNYYHITLQMKNVEICEHSSFFYY